MTDLAQLARSLLEAARKATPGPWRNIDGYLGISGRLNQQIESAGRAGIAAVTKPDDAAYIALCSPDVIAQLAEGYLALTPRWQETAYEHLYSGSHKAVEGCDCLACRMFESAERAEQEAARLREALREYDEAALEVLHVCAKGTAGMGTPQAEAFGRLDVAWVRARHLLRPAPVSDESEP